MKFESAEKTNADGYSRVVVGVDYSPCSRSAVKEAVRVARLNGAEVHVIHIIYDEAIAELKRVTGVKTEALVEGRTIRLERFVAESLGTESLESCIHCILDVDRGITFWSSVMMPILLCICCVSGFSPRVKQATVSILVNMLFCYPGWKLDLA